MEAAEGWDLSVLLEGLLERSPTLNWVKDDQHRLIYMNPAFGVAFGIEVDEWMHKSGWDLFPEDMAKAMAENDSRVQETLTAEQVTEIVVSDGRPVHYLSWKVPLPQEDGRVFLGGISIEITEQVEAERSLTKAIAAQQEESAFRDLLLGLLSHDVRGPLSTLTSLIDSAANPGEGLTDDDVIELLPDLRLRAHNTLELVDEVLGWARLGRQASHVPSLPVSLRSVAASISDLLATMAEAKEIEIDLSGLEGAWALTQPDLLRTAIRNILENAIKYSPEGGTVRASQVVVDDEVHVHIDDEGDGISDGAIAALARGDVQASRLGTHGELGGGVGLALCRDLLHRVGGELTAERRAGGGTRFTLSLPHKGDPTDLRRVVYVSRARTAFDAGSLALLVRRSRARNDSVGIGGVLLYSGDRFLQVLDGPNEAVAAVFDRISKDPRHEDVTTLWDERIEHAGYTGWTMHFTPIKDELIKAVSSGDFQALDGVLEGARPATQ